MHPVRHNQRLAPVLALAVSGVGACTLGEPSAKLVAEPGGSSTSTTPQDASTADIADAAPADAPAADHATDASDAQGLAPAVVADLGGTPASLALGGSTLYVTMAESAAGYDGALVSVPADAYAASTEAGTLSTIASGLRQPRAVAVSDGQVYWADVDATNAPSVMSVPAGASGAAAAPVEVVSGFVAQTRLCIVGSNLYGLSADSMQVVTFALGTSDGGAPRMVYPGSPPSTIAGPDSDGTNVYFFLPGSTNLDLFAAPIAGGLALDLDTDATSGNVDTDFVIDDATTVYWSDGGIGGVYAVAKTGGPVQILARLPAGIPAQLTVADSDLYILTSVMLARLPKTGGAALTVLAKASGVGHDHFLVGSTNAVALAVDATYVYWLHEGLGEILRVPR